jgi:mRNA-degrading endonuclease RelE of RelBE toxin-antitoxin system
VSTGPNELAITATALRALCEPTPRGVGERVAWAIYEFIRGPLLTAPRRVGKPLGPPLAGTFSARRGTYRVHYEIDDAARTATVTAIQHRADAYRKP